jgi:hypothetical protein
VDSALGASSHTVSKAKIAAKESATVTGVGAHRGRRTGPQPAKYLDPKTGATWSGKGPAPAWLAGAKDRSKFLIAGADAGSSDAASAKVAGKKTTDKKAAAKKALASKPAGAVPMFAETGEL